ncbi:hypothetical protein F4604DRAFT_1707459 [Suillus subluteus]|nr:hypothetical protein F4604DRAFT_1707459 [Suillus subluteus]
MVTSRDAAHGQLFYVAYFVSFIPLWTPSLSSLASPSSSAVLDATHAVDSCFIWLLISYRFAVIPRYPIPDSQR